MANELTAEYIVVGSGAGGGPLAARLALGGRSVLVLEAGGADDGLTYQVPAFHAQATQDPRYTWDFFVQHYRSKERQSKYYDSKYDEANGGVLYPRASTLGGCTAHNAMITVYPHNADWQHLADLTGDPSWGPESMRGYFERLEKCAYLPHPLFPFLNRGRHGFNGWLQTETADPTPAVGDEQLLQIIVSAALAALADKISERFDNPIDALKAVLKEEGADPADVLSLATAEPKDAIRVALQRRIDPNGWRVAEGRREGVYGVPLATRRGSRNGSREFLMETAARHPDRLKIETDALVTKVLLDGAGAAVGVEYLKGKRLYQASPAPGGGRAKGDGPHTARANREVILCGGTFNTPQLLMLSGVGPKGYLEGKRVGIPCRVDRPGVGGNLQDRYEIGLVLRAEREFGVLGGDLRFRPPADGEADDPGMAAWKQTRTGPYATNGAVLSVVRRSAPTLPDPDLFIFGLPGTFKGYFLKYADKVVDDRRAFTWAVLKGHTENRGGMVRLNEKSPTDPTARPAVNFHYFDEGTDKAGGDLAAVVEGVKFVRRMMGRPEVQAIGVREHFPGPGCDTDEKVAEFVRREAWGHHACGTCPIGADGDPNAVLDGQFRVRGVQNLRVVDASVFPRIPGFFIVTPIYMIAEKAADDILNGR